MGGGFDRNTHLESMHLEKNLLIRWLRATYARLPIDAARRARLKRWLAARSRLARSLVFAAQQDAAHELEQAAHAPVRLVAFYLPQFHPTAENDTVAKSGWKHRAFNQRHWRTDGVSSRMIH